MLAYLSDTRPNSFLQLSMNVGGEVVVLCWVNAALVGYFFSKCHLHKRKMKHGYNNSQFLLKSSFQNEVIKVLLP